jgi:L-ascorbate metabolism protein UlaG (beta-lactamase superfamily)
MRLKPGRPDLARYRDRFDVPEAKGARRVTFLGVSSLVLDDGESAIMTDGFFSRPSLVQVAARRITPDRERVRAGLRLGGVDRLDAVVPVHAHYDHVMDSPLVAEMTGARFAGDESALQVGVGHALPADRRDLLVEGSPVTYGSWTITPFAGHHCPAGPIPRRDHRAGRPRRSGSAPTAAGGRGRCTWRTVVGTQPWSSAAPATSKGRWPG